MRAADESWRLFIAVELPAGLRRAVQDHIDRLRKTVPDARASWTPEDNLHLTLKFLGETPVSKVESLSLSAQHTANQMSPFEIVIGGCGAFPPHGKPRVLWIGLLDESGQLRTCHELLENECLKAGFAREERPFHPHLTIARLRQPKDSRHLAELHQEIGFPPVSIRVSDLCLIKSELGPGGSLYTVVSRHKFGS